MNRTPQLQSCLKSTVKLVNPVSVSVYIELHIFALDAEIVVHLVLCYVLRT